VRLLVLGGTKFLGRAAVEEALARGHEVTLFNRGETNPDLFPEAQKLRGDRTERLTPLEQGEWDAVIDPSGYIPAVVRASAEALAGSVGHYVFVSSVSVYASLAQAVDENAPLAELGDAPDDRLTEDYSNYGALKALCEAAVSEVFGRRRCANVRPGLIVGAHDPTGRFTYWPHRVARGGEVLAPAPPERTVQFVDVKDAGRFLVEAAERVLDGAYNVTRPGVAWGELLETCRAVAGSDATFRWVPDELLTGQEVGEWMELPLWVADPDLAGIHQAVATRAVDTGLTFRPLEETVRDTLDQAATVDGVGLTPDRERDLLAEAAH
jgi:nucleoside-diphosphate-sugar epimerase